MIVGLGTDVVAIERIRRVLDRRGNRFLDRVLTADEQAYCLAAKDPAERIAARWAAKEATMKALGTGWAQGLDFLHISVRSGHGAPTLALCGAAAARADALGITSTHLSLSHDAGIAFAVVIASR